MDAESIRQQPRDRGLDVDFMFPRAGRPTKTLAEVAAMPHDDRIQYVCKLKKLDDHFRTDDEREAIRRYYPQAPQ